MENFDLMYDEIEKAFKTGTVDLCPQCKKPTIIHPNPFYFHKCENCGWEGSYRECIMKPTKQFVREIIKNHEKELLMDFTRYSEREWNCPDIPEDVIDEYLE